MLDHADDGAPDATVERWDPQMMIFTSGTTGPSKGVLCTYLQIHTTARVQYGYMNEDDRILIDLPMFHIGGVGSITGTLVTVAPPCCAKASALERFWERVHRFRATTTSGLIGSMPAFLSKLPPRDDDANNPLRYAIMPLTRQAMDLAQRHAFHYGSGFNMTELSVPLVTDVDTPVPGSCGRPRTGCECRIVDANDIECPPGVPGELIVRNDLPWTTSLGYVNQHEANARAWRNGWFHTGDLLYRDEAGEFFFVDRLKDAIRRRGENISSVEVEAEVYAFPGVGEVAAVGVPSEDGEEEVLVAVAPAPGSQPIDAAELVRFLVPRMPHYMVPRYVRVMASLPKTPTNKIRKVEFASRASRPTAGTASPRYRGAPGEARLTSFVPEQDARALLLHLLVHFEVVAPLRDLVAAKLHDAHVRVRDALSRALVRVLLVPFDEQATFALGDAVDAPDDVLGDGAVLDMNCVRPPCRARPCCRRETGTPRRRSGNRGSARCPAPASLHDRAQRFSSSGTS